MKKVLFILFLLVTSLTVDAQIKFMGIPIDGNKREMITKLQQKGFTKEQVCLELENAEKDLIKHGGKLDGESILDNDVSYMMNGRFDGHDCHLLISSYNKKVYQVDVLFKWVYSETQAKEKYNLYSYKLKEKYEIITDKKAIDALCIKYKLYSDDDLTKPFEKQIECPFLTDGGYILLIMTHPRYYEYYIGIRYTNIDNYPNGEDL